MSPDRAAIQLDVAVSRAASLPCRPRVESACRDAANAATFPAWSSCQCVTMTPFTPSDAHRASRARRAPVKSRVDHHAAHDVRAHVDPGEPPPGAAHPHAADVAELLHREVSQMHSYHLPEREHARTFTMSTRPAPPAGRSSFVAGTLVRDMIEALKQNSGKKSRSCNTSSTSPFPTKSGRRSSSATFARIANTKPRSSGSNSCRPDWASFASA